ncbi:class I SAM-dependent methyltransferase [Rhodanobacter sp. Root627]|uniref:class I SAM-dependent methyltransferase n=1 Tax=Rhodanobacter sp. Root627 TaxID=1736572 RepID=UPI00138F81B7|nr:class I SAM-dependent methyltransferase [Rhodanobacter sp. Root627]
MFKRTIANLSARLLRAAAGRVGTDLELTRLLQAASSSASLIDLVMSEAKACTSRLDVMKFAFDATTGEGFVCELGVYKGQSLNEIARWHSPAKVYGFDTFTGLPEFWREGFPAGAFDVSSDKLDFEKNCTLYKGLFGETLPVFLQDVSKMAKLIHVDCDLYSSTISALRILAPRISVGTVLVFDEYFNYPGWQNHEHKALIEFLSETGFDCKYLAYNKNSQQVAIIISAKAQ